LYSFLKGLSSVSGDFMQISSDLREFSPVFFLFWAKNTFKIPMTDAQCTSSGHGTTYCLDGK